MPTTSFLPRRRDQPAIQQSLQHARALYAANLHDFGSRNRLLVGDHRQSLQRGKRELQWRLQFLHKLPDRVVMLRLRAHLVSARQLAHRQSTVRLRVFRDKFGENFFYRFNRLFHGLGNLIDRQRFVSDVNSGFNHRF